MVRVTMILLCLILAAAAAGRYQAEVEVRETRNELRRLDRAALQEVSEIQLLRAEIAYLESPERLSRIADQVTELQPLSGDQLLTADEFVLVFGDAQTMARRDADEKETPAPQEMDEILRAVALADLGAVQ